MKIAIVATSLLLVTAAIPARAGHYGGDGGTNWGAVAGAGILGALLGAATVPQPPQQIIIVVPSQPSYVAPQPAPGISDREYLERYHPAPTPAATVQRMRWWCPASYRWFPDVSDCAVPWWSGLVDTRAR